MSLISVGIKSIKRGPIPDNGGMATVLTPLALIYKDTVVLKGEAPAKFAVMAEAEGKVKQSLTKGEKTITFSLLDQASDNKVIVMGGEVIDDAWEEPDVAPIIEESYQIITKDDLLIELPAVSVSAVENYEMKDGAPLLLDVELTPIKPKGAGVKMSKTSKYEKPVVNAGADAAVAATSKALVGTATAYRGDIVSSVWTVDSKPVAAGNPVFTDDEILNPTVSSLVTGVYKLRLTAKDSNDFENSDVITLTVTAP